MFFKYLAHTILLFVFSTYSHAVEGTKFINIHDLWRQLDNKYEVKASPNIKNLEKIISNTNEDLVNKIALPLMQQPNNVALMMIDGNSIVYEGYGSGVSASDRLTSFSMAKSLVSLAVGEAFCAGKIASLDDTANSYDKELGNGTFGNATIRHLLVMASGTKRDSTLKHGFVYAESSVDALFQKKSTIDIIRKYDIKDTFLFGQIQPGTKFDYNNLDTEILARVVAASTGMSFGKWFELMIAQRAGLESNSYWALDKNGNEIAHAFYFATLRDWARLAIHFRDILKSDENTCIKKYLQSATMKQISIKDSDFYSYGYQVWTEPRYNVAGDYWWIGYSGQKIGTSLLKNKIMLKFSNKSDSLPIHQFYKWIN